MSKVEVELRSGRKYVGFKAALILLVQSPLIVLGLLTGRYQRKAK